MKYINEIVAEELNRFIQGILVESVRNTWHKTVINDLEVYYAYDYLPQSDTPSGAKPNAIQRLVWWFKNDRTSITRIQHTKALRYVIRLLVGLIFDHIQEWGKDLVLVCVPASCPCKNQRRWKVFSEVVCKLTGIANGYPHVHVTGSSIPSHIGGGGNAPTTFDNDFFKGKNVVLFDDLVTTGYTMKTTSRALESAGARSVIHVALARSVQD
jgi:predicted amidophosphoribosyltransferase